MNRRTVLLAMVCVLSSGCLTSVDKMDIPCSNDQQCPTGYFCGLMDMCTSQAPVKLVFDGASLQKGGAFGHRLQVTRPAANQSVAVFLKVSNQGGTEADYPQILLSGPTCLGFNQSVPNNLIGVVPPGKSTTQSITVNPQANCPSPATVDVKMIADHRTFTDQLQVTLQ